MRRAVLRRTFAAAPDRLGSRWYVCAERRAGWAVALAVSTQQDREVVMSTAGVSEAKLEEFMGRMIGCMTGGAACFGIRLGDEPGMYSAVVKNPGSADDIAAAAGCNPRLVREWLDGQVAAGLVEYDAKTDSYSMSPEATMALADDSSPVFTARG
jgi:hypothetical protein